jgi:hypothetical protein
VAKITINGITTEPLSTAPAGQTRITVRAHRAAQFAQPYALVVRTA